MTRSVTKRLLLSVGIVIAILSWGVLSCFGQAKLQSTCQKRSGDSVPYLYYEAVLKQALQPPASANFIISAAASFVGSESVVVIGKNHAGYELLLGIPERNIHDELMELDSLCKLPSTPVEVAQRI